MKEKKVEPLYMPKINEADQEEAWASVRYSKSAAKLATIMAPFIAAGKTESEAFEMVFKTIQTAAFRLHEIWYVKNRTPLPGTEYRPDDNDPYGPLRAFFSLELVNRELGCTPHPYFRPVKDLLKEALRDSPDELERLTNRPTWKAGCKGKPIIPLEVFMRLRSAKKRPLTPASLARKKRKRSKLVKNRELKAAQNEGTV